MTVPNLPTDSLYKFGFVGGITLFVASLYILSVKFETYESLKQQNQIEQLQLKAGYSSFLESVKSLNELMEIESLSDESLTYINNKMEIYESKKDSLDSWNSEADIRLDVLEKEEINIKTIKYVTASFALLGLVVSIFCGCLWYSRTQKYLDYILKAEYLRIKK